MDGRSRETEACLQSARSATRARAMHQAALRRSCRGAEIPVALDRGLPASFLQELSAALQRAREQPQQEQRESDREHERCPTLHRPFSHGVVGRR